MTAELNPEIFDPIRFAIEDVQDESASLWRYMDLYKLLNLIQSSELHFTRADSMQDPWEGVYGTVNAALRPQVYGGEWTRMSGSIPDLVKWGRRNVFLNFWYMGEQESYAMWKLYDAAGKGVAVRSSVGLLRSAYGPFVNQTVVGSAVKYVDYSKTWIPEGNIFFPFTHKRLSFEFEHEYRLLAMPEVCAPMYGRPAQGEELENMRIRIDLEQLIQAIYISPDAPTWAADTVKNAIHNTLPAIDVYQSDLVADPVY